MREREDLAAAWIEHDHAARFSTRLLHRSLQRLFGLILNRLIDRQDNCLARFGSDLVTFVSLAIRVFFNKELAGLARDLRVVKLFDAAETFAVETDVNEHVCCE